MVCGAFRGEVLLALAFVALFSLYALLVVHGKHSLSVTTLISLSFHSPYQRDRASEKDDKRKRLKETERYDVAWEEVFAVQQAARFSLFTVRCTTKYTAIWLLRTRVAVCLCDFVVWFAFCFLVRL